MIILTYIIYYFLIAKMTKINSSQHNVVPVNGAEKSQIKSETKAPDKNQEKAPEIKDKMALSNTRTDKNISENIKLFDKNEDKSSGNGWKIKSVHLNAGYVVDNNVIHTGPMRIVNPEYNTDVTITGYKQIDRKNWSNINPLSGDRFAPDEPQFNLGVNMTFENNFGIELDGKHNKIIMDGYDQMVHFEGTINGQQVNGDAPLNSFVNKHENTFGNMQISALGTYTFDLPAPANHRFSFITKAGPSLVTTNTHSIIKKPDGSTDDGTSKLSVAGFGGIVENGFRYQFGPKVGQLGIEATHSLSYLNYSSYPMVGGYTANHSALYNSFAVKLTVGLAGNKN